MFELFEDDPGAVNDEALFVDREGFDSLKHVELIVAIERRFGIDLTADEIGRLTCKRAAREILQTRDLDV